MERVRQTRRAALTQEDYEHVEKQATKYYAKAYWAGQAPGLAVEYGLTTASICTGGTAGIVLGAADTAYGIATGKTKVPETAQELIQHAMDALPGMKLASIARGASKFDKLATHASSSSAASKMPVCMTKSHNPKAAMFKRVARDDWDVSTRVKLFGTDHVHVFKGDRVRAIRGQKPDNHALAGTTYHFENVHDVDLRNTLREKYPHGVPFTGSGLADFSRYALHKVKIDMTGKNWLDFSAANKAMGWKETPAGMTWHHHYDGKTMMLVPSDIHARPSVPHTGGAAIVKMIKETK